MPRTTKMGRTGAKKRRVRIQEVDGKAVLRIDPPRPRDLADIEQWKYDTRASFEEALSRCFMRMAAQAHALPLAPLGSGTSSTRQHRYQVQSPMGGKIFTFSDTEQVTLYAFICLAAQCLDQPEKTAWEFFHADPDPWNRKRTVAEHLAAYQAWGRGDVQARCE